jgi:RNA polymerase sigma factor (TIGR02999 family)
LIAQSVSIDKIALDSGAAPITPAMVDPATLPEDATQAAPEARRIALELIPIFYADLRRLAQRERRRVRAGETLQTTALVHEAFLKLQSSAQFNNREHFLRAAALAMRHALINHARERVAQKRGGGATQIPLEDAPDVSAIDDQSLLEINDALLQLAKLNPRLAQVVECRFFAGYEDSETAVALGMNERTVRRDWVKARAWLRRELDHGTAVAE